MTEAPDRVRLINPGLYALKCLLAGTGAAYARGCGSLGRAGRGKKRGCGRKPRGNPGGCGEGCSRGVPPPGNEWANGRPYKGAGGRGALGGGPRQVSSPSSGGGGFASGQLRCRRAWRLPLVPVPGTGRAADVKPCASQPPGGGLTVPRLRVAWTVAERSTRSPVVGRHRQG